MTGIIKSTILISFAALLAALCLALPTGAVADSGVNDSSSLSIMPVEQYFGFVDINGGPYEARIMVINRGLDILRDFNVSFSGPPAYTVSDGCKGKTLSLGEPCYLTVRFAPTELFTFIGRITVSAEEYDLRTRESHPISRSVVLSGTGGTGSLFPTVPVFETRRDDDRKQTQVVYVQNRSSIFTAQILGTSIIGTDSNVFHISADHCADHMMDPSSKCSLDITSSPPVPGVYHAELQIDNTGTDPHMKVPLTATVLRGPVAHVAPLEHDFGSINLGQESSVKKITVTNTGDQPLKIRRLLAPKHSLVQFPISSDTCTGSTLPPDDDCHLMISFIPDQTGHAAATYYLLTDAIDDVSQITVRGAASNFHTPGSGSPPEEPGPPEESGSSAAGPRSPGVSSSSETTPIIIPDDQSGQSMITGLGCRPRVLTHPGHAVLRFNLIESGPVTFQVISLHTTGKRITMKKTLDRVSAGMHLVRLTKLFPKLKKYASGSYRIMADASGSTAMAGFRLSF